MSVSGRMFYMGRDIETMERDELVTLLRRAIQERDAMAGLLSASRSPLDAIFADPPVKG